MKRKLIILLFLIVGMCLTGCSNSNTPPVSNITFIDITSDSINIEVGGFDTIPIEYDGFGNYSDLNITCDKENVLTFDDDFITFNGINTGYTTITVSAKNNPDIKDTIDIFVNKVGYKENFVRLIGPTDVLIVGNSMDLTIDNLKSLKAKGNEDFIFSVSDESILKLEGYKITALKDGVCTVYARQIDTPCNVGKLDIYVGLQSTDVTRYGEPDNTPLITYFDDNNYTIDASTDEQVRILGASNYQRYKYLSSNEHILLISDTGLFMGVSEGEVEVTIASKDTNSKINNTTIRIKVTGERKRDYVPILLKIALAEEGYEEWTGNNDTKYGEWNNCNYEQWCATFVSWCLNNAGVPVEIAIRSIAVRIFEQTYRQSGQFGLKGEYQPQPGDLIIFSSAGASHIGIVVRSDENNVYTIEGNTSNMVAQRTYSLYDETITGYVIPDYDK